MTLTSLLIILTVISLAFYFIAKRTVLIARSNGQVFHSLPNYYGLWAGSLAFFPAVVVLILWSIIDIQLFQSWVRDFYPPEILAAGGSQAIVALAKVENIVAGIRFGEPEAWVLQAGEAWIGWAATSTMLKSAVVLGLAMVCGLIAYRQIDSDFRARNGVEKLISYGLIAASTIAILTTIGIVLSVLFETIRFFQLVPPTDFIFGTEWNPQFEGAERAGSGGGECGHGV